MTYEQLLDTAKEEDLTVRERSLRENDGLIRRKRIAIRKDIDTQTAKACVLAEELGHYYTSVGNILNQQDVRNRKQELQARLWAYSRMITLDMVLEAKKCGCRNRYEIAELFGVTEEFLQNALDRYQAIYGIAHQIDNYLICFNPLNIYEIESPRGIPERLY